MKILLYLSVLILSNYGLAAETCLGLNEICENDCHCCGHPDNNDIRCDKRYQSEPKRCNEGRTLVSRCLHNSQCLSQNCVDGVCLPPPNPHVGKVELCSLGRSSDITQAANGNLPQCACNKPATDSLNLAMDGDLSTDYTNFHSKDISGFVFEPSFKSPLREMEVCTSNQDKANDPLCYEIYGECEHKKGTYDLLHHGMLELSAQRRSCHKVAIDERISYSRYKLMFGCRRGGYDGTCHSHDDNDTSGDSGDSGDEEECDPSKASCQEVIPKGKDKSCIPKKQLRNGARSFSNFFPHSIDYDDTNDVTLHTYSFVNKLGSCKFRRGKDLSHAVMQYLGACCVSKIRVYTIEDGVEKTSFTSNSPGKHLQSPKPSVCVSGIDLPGVEGSKTYYYELSINGYFPRTGLVDYVLKGGRYVKYGKVQGPDCRCPQNEESDMNMRRGLENKRMFRGLPLDVTPRKRRLGCLDKPVSISEVKLHGKCNED